MAAASLAEVYKATMVGALNLECDLVVEPTPTPTNTDSRDGEGERGGEGGGEGEVYISTRCYPSTPTEGRQVAIKVRVGGWEEMRK